MKDFQRSCVSPLETISPGGFMTMTAICHNDYNSEEIVVQPQAKRSSVAVPQRCLRTLLDFEFLI